MGGGGTASPQGRALPSPQHTAPSGRGRGALQKGTRGRGAAIGPWAESISLGADTLLRRRGCPRPGSPARSPAPGAQLHPGAASPPRGTVSPSPWGAASSQGSVPSTGVQPYPGEQEQAPISGAAYSPRGAVPLHRRCSLPPPAPTQPGCSFIPRTLPPLHPRAQRPPPKNGRMFTPGRCAPVRSSFIPGRSPTPMGAA